MSSADLPAASPGERLALRVYGALWYVATPFVAGYLLWRARRQPAYLGGWGERFLGRHAGPPSAPCLWIHAVSVGETRAVAPLVETMLARHPDLPILVTHMTPTGREAAVALFGDRVRHAYLAYDYPHAVRAFLRHWRPRLGMVMETEIWPGLMAAAMRAGVPMLLVNARLSGRSLASAQRWLALMRPAVARFARILAQTDADAVRFAQLAGTSDPVTSTIVTVGNVKFDTVVPDAQRELAARFAQRIGARRVFLFASTRDGEEDGIIAAWRRHGRLRAPDGTRDLLVVVPRHPQRFDAVAEAFARKSLTLQPFVVQRRSDEADVPERTDVWLGDSMGELAAYYLAADVAYVGGSIAPLGGQNLIEAAAAACPVLVGPHTFNFGAATDEAVRVGAAVRVADYDTLVVTGLAIGDDAARRRRMADAGLAFAAAHRGATLRTADIADRWLTAWGATADFSSP